MNKYEEYAVLQKEIDVLEAKKAILRFDIEQILPEEGYKDQYVTATWKSNKKWAYSPKVVTLEAKLKEDKIAIDLQKEVEEKQGIASCQETKSLVVKVKDLLK